MADRRPGRNNEANALGEGQAALWLAESLILALMEADIFDADTILEAIDVVIAAKKAKAAEETDPEVSRAAISHLAIISASIVAARTAANGTPPKDGSRTRQKPRT